MVSLLLFSYYVSCGKTEGFTTFWLTDVYAGKTVDQMLKGNQFNRVVRGSMTFSGVDCLISILISVKYLHDQEMCFEAV